MKVELPSHPLKYAPNTKRKGKKGRKQHKSCLVLLLIAPRNNTPVLPEEKHDIVMVIDNVEEVDANGEV